MAGRVDRVDEGVQVVRVPELLGPVPRRGTCRIDMSAKALEVDSSETNLSEPRRSLRGSLGAP